MASDLHKIEDLCEVTSSKRIYAKEYQDSGIPFYRGKEVTEKYNGNLNVTTELFITEEKYEEVKNKHGVPKTGDMLLTSVGTLGSTYIVKYSDKFYFKDGNLTWFRNFNGLNSSYLKYWLESPQGKGELKRSAIGAAQPAYTISNLKNMRISLPSEEEQKDVVQTISNYNNLIDNNNRRISILEIMVQSIYQEWFVKFRFPEYQNTKFEESSLGVIPEGWEIKAASEVIDIAPKMSLPKVGEKPFVSMPNVSTASMIIDEIEMRAGNSGTKFINGDTLLARITPCLQNGKTGFVQFLDDINPIGFGSTEFIVMRSKELTPEFVYCLARSDSFRGNAINSMAGADGRQRVKNECFNSYYLAVPPNKYLEIFSKISVPAFKEVFTLSQKNKNLKKQRDMLLPKLISGKMEL